MGRREMTVWIIVDSKCQERVIRKGTWCFECFSEISCLDYDGNAVA